MNKPVAVSMEQLKGFVEDPLKFMAMCWPMFKIYDRQRQIVESVVENDETIVPAAHQMGKDFITGMIVIWYFCSRVPCKIVTIAPGQTQLETVMWGEIRRFLQLSKLPLPIKYNHLDCKYILPDGSIEAQSRILGIATNKAENVQGQHLKRGPGGRPSTLAVFDEASGVGDQFYDGCDAWSHRRLIIGNPLPCTNFFFRNSEQGDVPRDDQDGYFQKVIRVRAIDSPNVRLALEEKKLKKKITNRILVPGLVSYQDYLKRRKLWDPIKQSYGLDGEFYKGAEVLLFPPDWLNHAEEVAAEAPALKYRKAEAIGVDSAEGGDSTVWTVIDRHGIIEQISIATKDTSDIPNRTIGLIKKYGVEPQNVLFDIGGGGKQHADQLRDRDYDVRTIAFGGTPTPVDAGNGYLVEVDKGEIQETRQEYKNKRAQMYGDLRKLLNPENESGFGIDSKYAELRRQLSPLPLLYDAEGKMMLPPKDKPTENYKGDTIRKILGRSPDEADSTVLAVHGLLYPARQLIVGAISL